MKKIDGWNIAESDSCFIIAEMSANHNQKFDMAVELVRQAKACGADAVKVQLYTPDTHTLPIDTEGGDFWLSSGLWKGNSLWNLYSHTYMPWAWYPELLELAKSISIILFPSVSELTALKFAEEYSTVAYKIPSFDIGDRGLLRAVAEIGKPMFVSMGCATIEDYKFIAEDLPECPIFMLHCVSEYPAQISVDDIEIACDELDGLSDHSIGIGLPIVCASNGAKIIEKHLWLGQGDCADREFSLSPDEFKAMVDAIRAIEEVDIEINKPQVKHPTPNIQRSIYAVRDIKKDDILTKDNIRIIRPGYGLDPRKYESILGKSANMDIPYGTALKENYIK